MKVGDTVQWVNGMGFVMTGRVIEPPNMNSGDPRPKVRESREGTVLYPRNAEVLEVTEADAEILRGEPDPLTVLVDGIVIEDDDEPIGTAYMGDVEETSHFFDINTLKELTLTTKQAIWLLSRNFSNDDEWTSPEVGDTYQENVDLKIQIAVTNAAEVRISTWQ